MDGNLAVAVLGVVLATASLVWQAATYTLTGGRVRVQLRVGATNGRALVTGPPRDLRPEWAQQLAEQGYAAPVVAVHVANVGRMPVTVKGWSIVSPLGMSMSPLAESIGPNLPHRLEAGESETWAVDMGSVHAFMEATRSVLGKGDPRDYVYGQVELGDGRTKRSPNMLR